MGLPSGRRGGHARVLEERDAREGPTRSLFDAVIQYFEHELQVAVSSVVYIWTFWLITVPDGTNLSSLPWVLGHVPCTYRFESDENDYEQAASRGMQPTEGMRDPFGVYVGDRLTINDSFSGVRDAVQMGIERRKVPSDGPGEEERWIAQVWVWVGFNDDGLAAGASADGDGSAILDQDGDVVAIFRGMLEGLPGYAIGVAGSTLEEISLPVVSGV